MQVSVTFQRVEGTGESRRAVAGVEPVRDTGDLVAAGAALAAAGEGWFRQGHEGLHCLVFTQFPSRRMNPFGSKLLCPFVYAISESPNEPIRLEIALISPARLNIVRAGRQPAGRED